MGLIFSSSLIPENIFTLPKYFITLMKSILNLQAEYLMWNARLDNSQARIKISKRNINNLRYADYTNLMAETEKELKELLIKMKEESENAGLSQH